MSHFDDVKHSDTDIKTLVDGVEDFAQWIFLHYKRESVRASKVIHDGVWGTHRFEAFEIELINTPLIQRLRQIHQTAKTYFTYPSTRHSRFEHTLGVTSQIGALIKALEDKFKGTRKTDLLSENLIRTLRLAAVLHDCGHGPLSHTSEEIYGKLPAIRKLKKHDPFKSAGPGEILSYLIIDTKVFRQIFKAITAEIDIDPDLLKNAIVGFPSRPEDAYKIDMLHGPFDADKIDYLFRDGHFSGLPLQIDLDRLWYSLDINQVEGSRRLTIDWGGASSLEQILFSKMTLYPTVYHHHKVRTCDCMFKAIIEYMQEREIHLEREINDDKKIVIDFKRPEHFLYFTDYDFFGWDLCKLDENLHELLHNLVYRRLLKRAIVISKDTIKRECRGQIDQYTKYVEEPAFPDGLEYYRWLAKKIWEEAGKPGLRQQVWVDCPKDPSFDEANDTWISPLGESEEPIRIIDFFNVDKYADQYKQKKWRSHVFCREEDIERISAACTKVFKEEFQIEFEPIAFDLCHVKCPL